MSQTTVEDVLGLEQTRPHRDLDELSMCVAAKA